MSDGFEDVESVGSVDSQEEDITIRNDQVVDKYLKAANIANAAMAVVLGAIEEGASATGLCYKGDEAVKLETEKLYSKKNKKNNKMKKGIAWPTCVSVNNIICHYSPVKAETTDDIILKKDDLVKIEIGSHVDGFPAFVAHTTVVGASADNKVTGEKADVMWAAYNAAEVAVRMLKPGTTNHQITEAIMKTTQAYGCKPIQNMASYNIVKDDVEGEKSILQNPIEPNYTKSKDSQNLEATTGKHVVNPALLGEKQDIEVGDVWAIDVLASTGEGKVMSTDIKTTLYRRNPDGPETFLGSTKATQEVISQINKRFEFMTFSIRDFEPNVVRTRYGLKVPAEKEVITQYPVMKVKKDELVAQFKYTVLVINENSIRKVTGMPFQTDVYETEKTIDDKTIRDLLATSTSKKAKKKNKNKAKKAAQKNMEAAIATN